jgi:hypothetical protein
MPQSPGRTVDTLHRQIMRRGHEAQGTHDTPTIQNAASNAPDTLKARSVYQQAFSSAGSPSYTDYRNSALSPSSFNTYPNNYMPASGSIYTEAEREAARSELLDQLISQLGTPTPPSADEGTEDDTWEDDGTSHQTSSGVELMALIQQQLHDARPRDAGPQAWPRLPSSNTPAQPDQFARPFKNSSSQQMLSLLNGPSNYLSHAPTSGDGQASPANSKPGTSGVKPQLAASTQHGQERHINPQMHASSLLSLFNGASKAQSLDISAGGPAPSLPSGDITRLFANARM